MQMRFREFNSDKGQYEVKSIIDVDTYDAVELFKLFKHMQNHEEDYLDCLEINVDDIVESIGDGYTIQSAIFVVPTISGELLPHFAIDVVRSF